MRKTFSYVKLAQTYVSKTPTYAKIIPTYVRKAFSYVRITPAYVSKALAYAGVFAPYDGMSLSYVEAVLAYEKTPLQPFRKLRQSNLSHYLFAQGFPTSSQFPPWANPSPHSPADRRAVL